MSIFLFYDYKHILCITETHNNITINIYCPLSIIYSANADGPNWELGMVNGHMTNCQR